MYSSLWIEQFHFAEIKVKGIILNDLMSLRIKYDTQALSFRRLEALHPKMIPTHQL